MIYFFIKYEAGAFTGASKKGRIGYFEQANGGTLFLDEIGEIPIEMQSKLLRTLQENVITRVGGKEDIPVNVRYISAINISEESKIDADQIKIDYERHESKSKDKDIEVNEIMTIKKSKEMLQDLLIESAIREYGSIEAASRKLEIAPSTIYRRNNKKEINK